ncbi:ParB/RepB/Spo0J family partition protein [Streptomyces sp. NPDC056638]|uniref:ParB/RepB/Spo0J family partition protein n=1 Tax=Streptomyces sp. NPDC056638 TaxID=3345887 RepID=UPI00367E68BD
MKKAESLGASATFDAVAHPISSRAASFARYAGQGEDAAPAAISEGPAPSPRLPVAQVAHNPFNPREELKAVEDMADSLTARGVIQPLTVVTRAAFLSAHPGHEGDLGRAAYVVVDGNRRLAGANMAGLDDVPVHIDDSLAENADTLLETALTAAIQHESLDPLDEAKALQRLVEVHGSQRAVARTLGKSSPWVTQRIALLKLTPELQEAVESKSLPVEVARNVGRLPAQQQQRAAAEALTVRAERKSRRRGGGANAVSTPTVAPPHGSGANAVSTAASTEGSANDTQTAPGVSRETGGPEAAVGPDLLVPSKKVIKMPWLDGEKVADIVIEKMGEEQREILLKRLIAARKTTGD